MEECIDYVSASQLKRSQLSIKTGISMNVLS